MVMVITTHTARIVGPVPFLASGRKINTLMGEPVPRTDPDPRRNGLLASLPPAEYKRWLPSLKLVKMPLGQVLHEANVEMTHVYFPVTAIVSILYVTENGSSAEIALAGNEGMIGIALFMGGATTTTRAVVQSAGPGYRIPAHTMKAAFGQDGPVRHLMLRYTQALITQMSQTAACNRHHSVHQQLCRRLLLSLDRSGGRELLMTQELIANMLGVRREGVTAEAGRLQADSAIRYHRGRITVLDRAKLEAGTCECYAVVKQEYDRLLPAGVST
jgi:CRP-like cAMP-binding protein